jgi:hypothetical protein
MAYLIDTSCLIQAKNDYYSFDFCPAFWDWLVRSNQEKKVFSIEPIFAEIDAGKDGCPLKQWATSQRASFFLPLDAATHHAMSTVSSWVQAGTFKQAAKSKFLGGADPFLIAYALAHKHTVITHEVHQASQTGKVKIPTVCLGLGVPCVRIFPMLTTEKASFVLAP